MHKKSAHAQNDLSQRMQCSSWDFAKHCSHLVGPAVVVPFEPFHLLHQTEGQPGTRHMFTRRLTAPATTTAGRTRSLSLLLLLLLERQQLFLKIFVI
jgi:hypothetical protein